MRTILFALAATFFVTTASAGILPNVDVNAIVDSVLGKDLPQGNCYSGYHVKVTKSYNAKGKYLGKAVTCEEDD